MKLITINFHDGREYKIKTKDYKSPEGEMSERVSDCCGAEMGYHEWDTDWGFDGAWECLKCHHTCTPIPPDTAKKEKGE